MLPSTSGFASARRRALVLLQATLLAATMAIAPAAPAVPVAAAADPPFADLTCTPTTALPVSANTGEKPQSKVWTHGGAWFAVLPTTAADPGSGTWLWKLVGTTWTSVLKLSNNTDTHADVLDTGTVTHILLYRGTASELVSVQYASGTYALWSTRPTTTATTLDSGVETATIAVDSAGRMWLASDGTTDINVRWSDSPYSTWSAAIPLATNAVDDDISVVTAFGGNMVGVLWSNQATKRFGFRVHVDGAAAGAWAADEVPASASAQNVGTGMADDHMNVAVAADGTLYAAVKTGYDTAGYPKMALLVRRPAGTWDPLYEVSQAGTRGILLLNEPAGELLFVYTSTEGSGNIVYRTSATSAISFSAASTLMSGAYNESTSTKQNYTDDLVILASSGTTSAVGRHCTVAAPVNHAPVASDGTLSTPVNTAKNGTLVASDSDGDTLTYSRVTNGTKGSAVITNTATGAYTYTPNAGQTGSDSFTFKANDGHIDSNTATVSVTITASANSAPVAVADSYATPQSTALTVAAPGVLGNDTDADGNSLTAVKVTDPAHGNVTLNANGSLTYTPTGTYTGPDSFTYKANDGSTDSNTVTVSLTVNAALAGPIGHWTMDETSGTTAHDTGAAPANDATAFPTLTPPTFVPGKIGNALQLNGTSQYASAPDEASLKITGNVTIAAWIKPESVGTEGIVKKGVTGGTAGYELSLGSSGKVFVRFNGSATYRVDSTTSYPVDGNTWVHVAGTYDGTTVKLYYNGVSENPKAASFSLLANTYPLSIGVNGDLTQYFFKGAIDDVRVYDRALSLAEIQALANVTPTNTVPVVNAGTDQTITLPATASLVGTATDDSLPNPPATLTKTWSKVSGPGTVTFGDIHVLATTATFGAAGTYVLRLTADDGLLSATDDVTITVNAAAGDTSLVGHWTMDETSGTTAHDTGNDATVNDATTVGNPTFVAGRVGNALKLNGTSQYATVPDANNLDLTNAITMAAWIKPGQYGTQDLIAKDINGGTDGYQLSLATTKTDSSSQRAFVRFNQVASADTYRVNATTMYPIDGTWQHVAATYDGTTIKLYINGVLEGSLPYTLPVAVNATPLGIGAQSDGTRWFMGAIDDVRLYNRALSATEILALATPANHAPVCSDVALSTPMNVAGDATPSCTDADGNTLSYTVTQPAHGTASVVSGKLHYVPAGGYTGDDTFTYKANDGVADSTAATVTVTVTPPSTDIVMVGAGDIADSSGSSSQTAALVNALPTATVFTLGDNAYLEGTVSDFANNYNPTWGAFKARTYPSIGNHDWTNAATGYFPYFSVNPVGSPNGWYSYDQGSYWHVIVLNSETDNAAGSPQELWLRADLAANAGKNVLAYWHSPRFSSDNVHGAEDHAEAIWRDLYEFGADLVVNGHAHWYERFAPQTPDGVADPTYGIREIVAGTGGGPRYSLGTLDDNSVVRDGSTWGVLKLTLKQTGYDWQFIPVAGGSGFTDSGTSAVHAAPPAPTGKALQFDGTNDYVTLGAAPGLNASTFTLEAWVKRAPGGISMGTGTHGLGDAGDGLPKAYPVLTKGCGENDGGTFDMNYWLGITEAGAVAADFEDMATGLNHPAVGITTFPLGEWHHIAATYDGRVWKLYLDGTLDRTLDLGSSIPPRSDSIQHSALGTSLQTTGLPGPAGSSCIGYFSGVIDEARVWNSARSAGDILANKNLEVTSGTGLLGRWGLNEGTGTTTADSTTPAENGTLTNGPVWVTPGFPVTTTNHAPGAPVLVSPANATTGVATSPTLDVTVTDPDTDDMDVTFYGRPVNAAAPDFTIVTLPDTQNYTTSTSGAAIFNAQTQWIVDSLSSKNIKVTAHLGDVVNTQANGIEWTRAATAMGILDTASVPYGFAPGNHDVCTESTCGTYNAAPFDAAFPLTKYSGKSWYTGGGAGAMAGREYRDSYQLFSSGGLDFILIDLEINPPASVVSWANGLLTTYASRRAIITTHDYLTGSGTRSTAGTALWDSLVVGNCNVFMVLSGHASEEAQLTTTRGASCQPVYQVLQDYQGRTNGGDGWLRYYTFKPSENKIYAYTFSPALPTGASNPETDANSQFTLDYTMGGAGAWQVIGTATGVHSGAHAAVPWNGLANDTQYEWYATVSDGSLTTAGSTWSFTTAPSSPTTHTVSGTVKGTGAVALPGTYVHVFDAAGSWVTYTVADGAGAYSFTLPPATYKLMAQPVAAGYPNTWYGGTDFTSASPVNLTSADATANFSLVNTHTVSGTVKGTGAVALPGTYVHVFDAAGSWVTYTVADGAGAYSFTLPPATYKLMAQPVAAGYPNTWYGGTDFTSASPVNLTSADATANFSLVNTHTVSGTVKGTGAVALPGTYVHVFDAAGSWVTYTVADGAGAYSFTLPPATYKLMAQPVAAGYPNTWYGGTDFTSASPVNLTSADATANFSLVNTHTVSGTVKGTGAVALPGTYVHVFDAAGSWVTYTVADGAGAYSFTLPPATYKLMAQPVAAGYPNTWYGGTDFTSASPVNLTSADATANFSLVNTHTVSGTVKGTGAVALPGTYVHVFDAAGSWVTYTVADGAGAYSFTLPPATYKLMAQPVAAGYPNTWYGGTDFTSASPVNLTSADAVANFSLVGG